MFQPGSIYACQYMNFKHDPSPLLFVFHSDRKYVEGLNLNYLTRYEKQSMAELIMRYNQMFMDINITGVLLYKVMKRDIYAIVRKSYRKYAQAYIRGFMVSRGLKNQPGLSEPQERVKHVNDEFVKYLNNMLRPDVMTLKKAEMQPRRNLVNRIFRGIAEKVSSLTSWWSKKY